MNMSAFLSTKLSFAHEVMKLNSMSPMIGFEVFPAHSGYRNGGLFSESICVKETTPKAYF